MADEDVLALLEFCSTDRQTEIIKAIHGANGSLTKAAKSIGIAVQTVHASVKRIRNQAAVRGYAPRYGMTRPVAPTHIAKGTSALYRRGEDEPLIEWVKSSINGDRLAAIAEEAARSFFADRKPLKPIKRPAKVDTDLLSVYVLADLHLGMFAWGQESGADWDCSIATRCLSGAMDRLMQQTQPSAEAVIAQLGDFLHMDDDTNQTPRGKNPLDVDSRFPKVARTAIHLYRHTIDRALQQHDHVTVVNVPGNHDEQSALWVKIGLELAYENEPRVTIKDTAGVPAEFEYHQFGKCLFGFTHGHTSKMTNLGEIMVADQPRAVGETEFRYFFTGHIHHERRVDGPVCRAESFRCLPAKDAWHARNGYRSSRDMTAISFDREYGERARFVVTAKEALEAQI